jgi:hypothetical protein
VKAHSGYQEQEWEVGAQAVVTTDSVPWNQDATAIITYVIDRIAPFNLHIFDIKNCLKEEQDTH